MKIDPLQRPVKAEDIPLERLAASQSVDEPEKVSQVSRAFESVLLRQILQETQKPLLSAAASDRSAAGGIYRDMITNQLADSIARSGAFGLAHSLEAALQRKAAGVHGNGTPAAAERPVAHPSHPSVPHGGAHRS